MLIKYSVIAAYVVMIVAIGVLRGKKTASFNDFFLGGGQVGPWMTAFTYGATYFSAVVFIGFAGKVGWQFGYSGLWIALGNSLLGVLAVWWLLGERIKKMSQEYQVATMAEFFEKRYQSKFLKIFSSASIFVFFIPYSAAVFIGLSYLFKLNFNTEYWQALVFMGLFTAVYMVLGGYKSMSVIDVVFSALMIFGSGVVIVSVLGKAGGLAAATDRLSAIDPKLTALAGPPGIWPLFCLVFLTSVAPFAMPQLVQKFYAVRDRKAIRLGMWVSTAFAVFFLSIAYYSGTLTRLFLSPENAPAAFAAGKPVFDSLMPEMLIRAIPASLSVFILLLILSASMSTLAALVLISSSALAKDLYAGFINPKVSDRSLTRMMRGFSAFFILLSVIFAYYRPATIVSILAISWGAIGSVFLGPFVWGLLSKRVNRLGAVTSSVLGLGVCMTLYFTGSPTPEAGTVGMLVSLAMPPVFSLFGRKNVEVEMLKS
ncbi:MAG TPA: sodium:solute symporter [Candidatus Binatia bacterium]|nr:sodium:solute symporter [Candidatus Binatia bacterium]